MMRDVRVHLLPGLFEPTEVEGGCVVILDILRASTTIVHALANGARAVLPTLDVDTARKTAAGFAVNEVLTGGERDGVLIPGFQLDNNPFAYAPDVVGGKTVVFTTTNGTLALHRAARAERVLIGAFVNLSAVVRVLAAETRPVHFVCAGTMGRITLEDVLAAGTMAQRLADRLGEPVDDWTDDCLQLAVRTSRDALRSPSAFLTAMRNSFGGRNCRRLGFDAQIERAATFDLFDFVPEYTAATGQITLGSGNAATS
jgi:2-phosphosulfolactate phosphatase